MAGTLLDKPIPILFGTTPPMKRSQASRQQELTRGNVDLVQRLGPLCHGVVVYDVWEGNERGKFRNKYGDNRPFAQRLREATGKEVIVCNVVVHNDGLEGFGKWLEETTGMELWSHVYVGASTEKYQMRGPHPRDAMKLAANRHGGDVTIGSITIPWRFNEARRLAKKVELGSSFALSQIVLEPHSGKHLVDQLGKMCSETDLDPPLIFWNFAPVVDLEVALEDFDYFEVFPAADYPAAKVAAQKNWDRIAFSRDPLKESIEVAAENLEQLLEHCLRSNVKPGITVEGLGLQNLPYVEGLFRRLSEVRAGVVKKHYGLA